MVRTTLIILTRNEIEGLKGVIRKIPFEAVDEYFAVDYKSTDGTIEFFKKYHIPVIAQSKSGRAEAFYLGAEKAKGKYLIFFSPDGNENPADIPRLISELKNGNNLVIASRFLKNSRNEEDDQIIKLRAWANQTFSLIANLIWGGKLSDTINGYRGIEKKYFEKMHLDAKGFAIEYQMSIRALKLKLKISEIPTIEGTRLGGQSTSYAIPTGLRFIYFLLREVLLGNSFLKETDN